MESPSITNRLSLNADSPESPTHGLHRISGMDNRNPSQASSPWRNSVHSNDVADNGDSDDFVVVMIVESKNEVFSIPESLETIE